MDKYLIWLSQIKGVGPVLQKKLLEAFECPEAVFHADKAELKSVPGVGAATAESILNSKSLEKAEGILEKAEKLKIKILTCHDPLYPELAKTLPRSPLVLYYLGNIKENSMGVCIVGARRCTNYGKTVTREAAGFLAKEGIPVISGLAKGIDSYAHTSCIKNEGYTLAFVASGVDICYPKEHRELREAVINNGAVISQFPPNTSAKANHFPVRNYLMSAWAFNVLVVEAGEKSGSLITAKLASEQGKQVLAVPNNIYSPEGRGTNLLIAKGAEIYLKERQLLMNQDKGFAAAENKRESNHVKKNVKRNLEVQETLSPIEKKISELIAEKPQQIEKLSLLFSDRLSFLETISLMELEEKIERLPGGMIRKSR
ncbi:DNA-protecting protein DprA [Candidatus Contubernalis alkalaceticus]|nr:DNA-protecting protein DprA [Candidatus Contubernalis alkalaceticus]